MRIGQGSFGAMRRAGAVELLERDDAVPVMREMYDRVRRTRPGMLALTGVVGGLALVPAGEGSRGTAAPMRSIGMGSGRADGFVAYTVKHEWPDSIAASKVEVRELITDGPGAYADLWRFVLDIDLVAKVEAWNRPADEPLVWLMTEPRRLRMRLGDALWVRLVDVPAAMRDCGATPRPVVWCSRSRIGSVRGTTDGSNWSCTTTAPRPASRPTRAPTCAAASTIWARCSSAGEVRRPAGRGTGGARSPAGWWTVADRMFGTWPAPWSSFVL